MWFRRIWKESTVTYEPPIIIINETTQSPISILSDTSKNFFMDVTNKTVSFEISRFLSTSKIGIQQ